jgi:hypothetical protein
MILMMVVMVVMVVMVMAFEDNICCLRAAGGLGPGRNWTERDDSEDRFTATVIPGDVSAFGLSRQSQFEMPGKR